MGGLDKWSLAHDLRAVWPRVNEPAVGIVGSIVWNDFPALNITLPYLMPEGIDLAFEGQATAPADGNSTMASEPLEAHNLAHHGDIEHYAVISYAISVKRIADRLDRLVALAEIVVKWHRVSNEE